MDPLQVPLSDRPQKMEIPIDPGRPIKHVNRKELYTSLEARIRYLREMVDFNSCMSLYLSLW